MGKKLAIEHHLTRPNEVIELLEMMGGKNTYNADGCSFLYYTLCTPKINNPNNDEVICGFTNLKTQNDHFAIFTLENFWKKYPYKVGDKVEVRGTGKVFTIGNMIWEDKLCTVHYANMEDFEYYTANELKLYKETNMNENKFFSAAKTILASKSNSVKLVDNEVVDNLDEEKTMEKKLAIRGHSTRGKEVIKILKMLGGCESGYEGLGETFYYYINQFGSIEGSLKPTNFSDYKIFTLEEFLEKYPYKVGDIVDKSIDYVSCFIDNMRWNSEKCCVEYHLNYLNGSEDDWYVSECLIKPENEDVIIGTKIESTGFMQMEKTVSVIFNSANYDDEVELQLGDYKIEVRDGKTYAVRNKPVYPKTYKGCCDVLLISPYYNLRYHTYERSYGEFATSNTLLSLENKLNTLGKLLICRDAYWKISGEEMGLDKPWEPDWSHGHDRFYCIATTEDEIVKGEWVIDNKILAFPTKEMRDMFYENFKELIESCKELL